MDAKTLLEEFKKFINSNEKRTSHDEYMARKSEEFLRNLEKQGIIVETGAEKIEKAVDRIPKEVIITNRRVLFQIEVYTRQWLLIILGSVAFLSIAAYFFGANQSQETLIREINSLNTQLRKSEEHSNYHRQFSKKVEADWEKLQAEK